MQLTKDQAEEICNELSNPGHYWMSEIRKTGRLRAEEIDGRELRSLRREGLIERVNDFWCLTQKGWSLIRMTEVKFVKTV